MLFQCATKIIEFYESVENKILDSIPLKIHLQVEGLNCYRLTIYFRFRMLIFEHVFFKKYGLNLLAENVHVFK